MPHLSKRLSNLKQYDKKEELKMDIEKNDTESEIESDIESDDEYFVQEVKIIEESLIAEIVHFIVNENASIRSLSVLVFAILKFVFFFIYFF